MTSFPGSPKTLKGGFILMDAEGKTVLRTVAFQYNPDSLTRMQVRMRDGWKLGFHEGADRIDLRFRHDGQVPIAVAKDADQSACGQQFRIAPVVQLLPNE